jgi:hypothetical protein
MKSRYVRSLQSEFDDTFLAFAFTRLEKISNSTFVQICLNHAVKNDLKLPHIESQSWSKKDGFLANLAVFDDSTKFSILEELSKVGSSIINPERKEFRIKLYEKFGHLKKEGNFEVFSEIITETQHFLGKYPKAYEKYQECVTQFSSESESIHLFDDLRKSVEFLLKEILNMPESNWNSVISELKIKSKQLNFPTEFREMLFHLMNFYDKYQNEHVKHKEEIMKNQVVFIFELTTTFLRFYATNFPPVTKEKP